MQRVEKSENRSTNDVKKMENNEHILTTTVDDPHGPA